MAQFAIKAIVLFVLQLTQQVLHLKQNVSRREAQLLLTAEMFGDITVALSISGSET